MRRRFLNNINKSISGGNDYHSEYFSIEALEDGLTASLSVNACEYSLDGNTWNSLSAATNTLAVNTGEKIYFRGNLTPTSNRGIGTFTISKKCNVKGNVMSLLYGDDFEGQIDLTGKNYAFYRLFYNCTNIVDAFELILPATTLASNCYSGMFDSCTSLTTAPALPATTLAEYCYSSMFRTCIGLTSAPALPATTLANYCYYYMLSGCTGLTSAPALPATTLADGCYYGMFNSCSSLTTAPELPATTLADSCYSNMFYGTNALPDCSNIDFNSTSVIQSGGLKGLFEGTKVTDADLNRILPKNSNGKYCLPVTTLSNSCYYSMFSYCRGLTTPPELPATTLVESCYKYMFSYCTSLTTAPELPSTTLADDCYYGMFNSCSSLTTAPELPATTLASHCYSDMFKGCNKLTTPPELPATTLVYGCYISMFRDCTALTAAPDLPSTTLANYCYYYMFSGCTSLTIAPALPATTLAKYCYNQMFSGCKNLNYITMLATDIIENSCLSSWVNGVSSIGTFVKHPDMTSLPTGISGIPYGWTVEDYVESNLITFRVINKDYQAEEGMTWNQWLYSEYNTINAYESDHTGYIEAQPFIGSGVDGMNIIASYEGVVPVLLDDIIINNHTYIASPY